jgi:hypothetical protein
MDKIIIEYLSSLNDHLEAYAYYENHTTQRKIDKIVSIISILSGLFLIILSMSDFLKYYDLIIAFIFIISGLLGFFGIIDSGKIATVIQFKNNLKFKNIQKIKFTDNDLEYESQGIKSKIDWDFYKKYMESENVILLIYGKKQYSIIPKRSFKKNELDSFKIMLNKKFQ